MNLLYVKDTLEMNLLAGKSVGVVRRELRGGLLAYNVIRAYMTLAAKAAGVSPSALSFTQCWRRIRDTLAKLRPTDTREYVVKMLRHLLSRLAGCKLAVRLRFRIEPRAVRRRQALYPALKGSRAEARQRLIEQLQSPSKS